MTIAPVGAAARAPAAAPAAPARPSFAALLEARTPFPARRAGRLRARAPRSRRSRGVERAQARLDAVLAAARSGRTFTAAGAPRPPGRGLPGAQTVDLAAKLVEQGAQSVKQALNTQV